MSPLDNDRSGRRAARSAAAPLPCLNSHNSNGGGAKSPVDSDSQKVASLLAEARKMGGSATRTAYGLRTNVADFVSSRIERCAFIALTFGGGGAGPSCREATRRFNSFLTGAMRERYPGGMRVLERGEKKGRVHFHLLADVGRDIRSGVDVEAVQRGDYSTASKGMREEYAWLKRQGQRYGFGVVVNVQPVKSCDQAIAKYLAKYVSKHVGRRELRDKGARLVAYWGTAAKTREVCSSRFSWTSPRARLWRWQVGEFARRHGCTDGAGLAVLFGKRWAYWQRTAIMAIEPPRDARSDQGSDQVTMWDIWHGDRMAVAHAVSVATGCTQNDAFQGVFLARVASVQVDVPRWKGVSLSRIQREQWDRTIIWSDGRVER